MNILVWFGARVATTVPSGPTIFVTVTMSGRCPRAANVEYARAISSGVTPNVPSVIEQTGWSGLVIPASRAACRAAWGPTFVTICANTVLTESSVARITLIRP